MQLSRGLMYLEHTQTIQAFTRPCRAMRANSGQTASTSDATAVNSEYLKQKLHYTPDGTKLLDADGEAVMMGWEVSLVCIISVSLCHKHGVSFGTHPLTTASQPTHNSPNARCTLSSGASHGEARQDHLFTRPRQDRARRWGRAECGLWAGPCGRGYSGEQQCHMKPARGQEV